MTTHTNRQLSALAKTACYHARLMGGQYTVAERMEAANRALEAINEARRVLMMEDRGMWAGPDVRRNGRRTEV